MSTNDSDRNVTTGSGADFSANSHAGANTGTNAHAGANSNYGAENSSNTKPRRRGIGRRNAVSTTRDMLGIVAVVLIVIILALFIALNFNSDESTIEIDDRYHSFSDGWRLQTSERDEIISLPAFVEIEAYGSARLSKELPQLSPHYAIATRNYHQELSAYANDTLLYHFPNENKNVKRSTLTDDWNMIKLDESMTGQTFTLEFTADKYGFSGYIKPAYLGEDNALVYFLRSELAVPYGMAVSVIALGVILLVLGLVYRKYNDDRCQIIAGLMLISIGIWVTNRSKMPLLLVGSSAKFFLSFLCLMIESILILMYVQEKFKEKNRKLTRNLIIGFSIFLIATTIVLYVINFPIDQAVPIAYFCIFLASVYLIYMLWGVSYGKDSSKLTSFTTRSNRIELIATVIMVAGVVLGIIIDFAIGSDRLWTDVGALPKISLNSFAVGQLLVHIYRSYHHVEEREELQSKLHDSQLELMMGQIQPHFIFNTLSSIRTLIKIDPDTAYTMIYDFSNYLRANVDNVTNLDGIKFAAEVEHISSYANIEKVRFGDRLTVEYDIQSSDFIVPPLSIQPLVENAIKHGVMKDVDGGTVILRSYTDGDYNIVEVEDDGVGFTPERLREIRNSLTSDDYGDYGEDTINLTGNGSENHKSSGMRNIYLRLKEISDADLFIESEVGKGTKVTVKFPIQSH